MRVSPMAIADIAMTTWAYRRSIRLFAMQKMMYRHSASRSRAIIFNDNDNAFTSETENENTRGAAISMSSTHRKNLPLGICMSFRISMRTLQTYIVRTSIKAGEFKQRQ